MKGGHKRDVGRHKKRINLSSDLKTFILILFLRHYLKWKIFHFLFRCFVISVRLHQPSQARPRRRSIAKKANCSIPIQHEHRGMKKKTSWFYRDLTTTIAPKSLLFCFFCRGVCVTKSKQRKTNPDVNVTLRAKSSWAF